MAVLQNQGRTALARAIASQSLYLAWGRGLPAWDAAPEPISPPRRWGGPWGGPWRQAFLLIQTEET